MEIKDVVFHSVKDVVDSIVANTTKGGSPFGRAVAWGIKFSLTENKYDTLDQLKKVVADVSAELVALKPTMATMKNTADIVDQLLGTYDDNADPKTVAAAISKLCDDVIKYSFDSVDNLGAFGGNLVHDGDKIMINSYSSSIMSVFAHAAAQGKKFTVISTESRPFRESIKGANFLNSLGVKVIWISDPSMHEFVGKADWCVTGADTLCWDGSAANKMGTAQLAELAFARGIPFYIASEVYKLKRDTKDGNRVELEIRPMEDLLFEGDFENMDNITVINQFFDLTPACHITGLITEFGVIPPATVGTYWDELATTLIGK